MKHILLLGALLCSKGLTAKDWKPQYARKSNVELVTNYLYYLYATNLMIFQSIPINNQLMQQQSLRNKVIFFMKWISILGFGLFVNTTHAQTSLANEQENIAYIGVDNPLSFAVFGFACGDIAVSVDNGTLLKVPNQCGRFIYRPANTGTAKFLINGRKGEDMLNVDIKHFRVIRPPAPSEVFFSVKNPDLMDELTDECCAQINIKDVQQLSVTQLVHASGLGCSLADFHYPIRFEIKQFDYTIKRNNQIVKKNTNYGARCDTQFKEALKSVQAGDSILFDNIRAEVSSEKYALQAFEISIVE